VRRFGVVLDWLGETFAGLLFVTYAVVAVGGILVGVLAGLHVI
jgi:hypothetical protein